MTDSIRARHKETMQPARSLETAVPSSGDECAEDIPAPAEPMRTFEEVYDRYADFVWSSLRGLGVAESAVDDAVQDVFVVVHRRLGEFEGRSTLKTWIFGVAAGVARNHRRSARRTDRHQPLTEAGEIADHRPGPLESTAAAQALEQLAAILDQLDDAKREVLVLTEWEQMSAPQIAEALAIPVNTVYSRLRLARAEFDRLLAYRNGSES